MSDTTDSTETTDKDTVEDVDTTQADTDTADTGGKDTNWKAEAEKYKALSRKHEKRAKDNAAAATKLAEIEESQKSEAQKTADRLAKAEAKAREAELKLLRADVAAEKKLPKSLASRLRGETREELEADADQLLEDFPQQQEKSPPKDFGGGAGRGSDIGPGVKQWTKADLEGKSPKEINEARRKGHLDQLMGKQS